MSYHLDQFYCRIQREPTPLLDDFVYAAIGRYEQETDVSLAGIHLVGGLARVRTSPKQTRKDVDLLLVPQLRLPGDERERLYFLITASIREELGEFYDVFVGRPLKGQRRIRLTDHYL